MAPRSPGGVEPVRNEPNRPPSSTSAQQRRLCRLPLCRTVHFTTAPSPNQTFHLCPPQPCNAGQCPQAATEAAQTALRGSICTFACQRTVCCLDDVKNDVIEKVARQVGRPVGRPVSRPQRHSGRQIGGRPRDQHRLNQGHSPRYVAIVSHRNWSRRMRPTPLGSLVRRAAEEGNERRVPNAGSTAGRYHAG